MDVRKWLYAFADEIDRTHRTLAKASERFTVQPKDQTESGWRDVHRECLIEMQQATLLLRKFADDHFLRSPIHARLNKAAADLLLGKNIRDELFLIAGDVGGPPEPQLVTVAKAMLREILGISAGTLAARIKSGEIRLHGEHSETAKRITLDANQLPDATRAKLLDASQVDTLDDGTGNAQN